MASGQSLTKPQEAKQLKLEVEKYKKKCKELLSTNRTLLQEINSFKNRDLEYEKV